MKLMAVGAGILAAMLATPAMAQAVDPDMLCMVAMATAAETIRGESTARIPYDRTGGYYLAIVAKRYPTAELFAPPLRQATSALQSGDKITIYRDCIKAADPALDLLSNALDIIDENK